MDIVDIALLLLAAGAVAASVSWACRELGDALEWFADPAAEVSRLDAADVAEVHEELGRR